MRRLLLIGLDSAPPRLIEELKGELPNTSMLVEDGLYGPLRSTDPPITIPAWASMLTGRDPGELGLYGFRHRKPGSYTDFYIASSKSVKHPWLWDYVGEAGGRSLVMGVPPSYPPKPLRGALVSCFITPSGRPYTYPLELRGEVEEAAGGKYIFDIEFRIEDRDKVLHDLYEMTEVHFKVLSHLMEKRWDLVAFVEIGVDRLHHAFWKYYDKAHPKYEPGNRYEHVIPEYYKYIDSWIGRLLEKAGDALVCVVSDHGAMGMKGALCINQWLAEQGYLKLEEQPPPRTPLAKAKVDWSRTKAWGWGGYYARVFLNVEGREPSGVVPRGSYEEAREELAQALEEMEDPDGRRMATKAYRPEELYREVNGDPPDLIVYLDDLSWRSAGTIGYPTPYLPENDTGPDDAVHSKHGVFTLYDPEGTLPNGRCRAHILDVLPTLLDAMELEAPRLAGRSLLR